ncbi:MAG: hypothetical protein A3K77_00560 [Euryarchaeota archaeon RBG_13_31_8]|nr:MAG: hypothetical protein A3K77_00560 [Euryarchaeota archaeon RBG_13_31_8]
MINLLQDINKKKIILRHHRQAGDILVMSTLIRQFKKQYGDKILLLCDTPVCQGIWWNNNYLTSFENKEADLILDIDYKYVIDNPQWMLHHSYGFKLDFENKTNIVLNDWDCRPYIKLTEYEKELVEQYKQKYGNFWIISSNINKKCTVKSWPNEYWIEFISNNPDSFFIQVGTENQDFGLLTNLVDLTRKTGVRDLFVLICASKGVISYNSFCMHIAAAFNKKAIILAGGREPIWYQQYPNQYVFNLASSIHCGNNGEGCLKKNIEDCKSKISFDNNVTEYPMCYSLIKPDLVNIIFHEMR